jgi:Mg-chelatase subunit ChlD
MSTLERWRLVLGRYAEPQLSPQGLQGQAGRRDRALEQLYGREYRGRGLRAEGEEGEQGERGPGSLEASQPGLLAWLGEVRELFPRETVEIIEKHALERYGLSQLLSDPQTLERLEPNPQLLRTLLALRGHLHGEVLALARRIIRQVVEQLRRQFEPEVRRTLAGRLQRQRHAPMAMAQNFDPRGTLRANLQHYDREQQRLLVERLSFFERNSRRLPWHIILCVDQSGSMVDSVIHSAVMAGIFAALPALRVKLLLFDTGIVDLSEHAEDPAEVLLRAQLGGGTDIGRALRYCSQLVEVPQRTVLVLVSDFCEGAAPAELLRAVRQLAEARVRLLGLAALDGQAQPAYDRQMAERLAACGMEIAALTPQRLAQWLLQVIS